MGDLVSISEAATRLGLHRSKLSVLISEAGIKTMERGRQKLVDFNDVMSLVQVASAEKKLRSPTKKTKPLDLEESLREEVRLLKAENIELRSKAEVLQAEVGEMKLLRGQVQSEREKITSLELALAKAESRAEDYERRLYEELKGGGKKSLLSRLLDR